jgi:hypothetical protein
VAADRLRLNGFAPSCVLRIASSHNVAAVLRAIPGCDRMLRLGIFLLEADHRGVMRSVRTRPGGVIAKICGSCDL